MDTQSTVAGNFSVSTMLSAPERAHVDSVSRGLCTAVHRDSLDAVLSDVKESRAQAVVFSLARYGVLPTARIATIVREFPQVPAIALLTGDDQAAPHAALSLGHIGVRTLVDVRHSDGWTRLRSILMAERSGDVEREALSRLALDLAGAPRDCWRFFELLFATTPRTNTVRQLASNLRVLPSTLLSRFFRAKLPPPKRYLSLARLIRAAKLFENPGFSVAAVANHLRYSSPQSFGRHVRNVMGMSPVAFRSRFNAHVMMEHFRAELVLPHAEVLRQFHPVDREPAWVRPVGNFRPVYAPPLSRVAERSDR
jgi:AraC-like DNA-binding protein